MSADPPPIETSRPPFPVPDGQLRCTVCGQIIERQTWMVQIYKSTACWPTCCDRDVECVPPDAPPARP